MYKGGEGVGLTTKTRLGLGNGGIGEEKKAGGKDNLLYFLHFTSL